MQYQPESPEGYRKFDPATTAHLFEKGISAPKFTNPKLWFIKGPLKYLFTSIIDFYSLVDKKLSENRLKAFFSVLHELIRLNKRISNIEKRLDSFRKEVLNTSATKEDGFSLDFGWSTYQYFESAGKNDFWSRAVEDMKGLSSVAVLFPSYGMLLKDLTIAKVPFKSFTNLESEYSFIKNKICSQVELVTQTFPLQQSLNSVDNLIIFLPLNRFPSIYIEKILSEASELLTKGSHIYLSVLTAGKEDLNRVFTDIDICKVDTNLLPQYMKTIQFDSQRNLTIHPSLEIFRFTKV
ncbi:hypothetical protein LPTSP4_30560 [Leptospira ryugenii]|uniref:Uncharacterized protein n=2 Tax=Leptospira ryugenii TaxID=1917863 RepID=A0A2P2E3P9_9LEPT|nr:hypothetical protein LPTSP4_30560 [Leptospira ryugenii]